MKTIDHFYSYRTYSGCLEGPPSIDSMLKSVRNSAERLWGQRPTNIIEPRITKIDVKHPSYKYLEMLPQWTHMAWASGREKDPKNDGSQLVIIWFSDEPMFDVDNVVNSVDWDLHAEDFQY